MRDTVVPRIHYLLMDAIRLLTPRIPNFLQKVEDLLDAFPTIEGGESFYILQYKHLWLLGLDNVHDAVHNSATFIVEASLEASYRKW